MRQIIKAICRMFFLVLSVAFGFFLVKSWKENEAELKPKLAKLKAKFAEHRRRLSEELRSEDNGQTDKPEERIMENFFEYPDNDAEYREEKQEIPEKLKKIEQVKKIEQLEKVGYVKKVEQVKKVNPVVPIAKGKSSTSKGVLTPRQKEVLSLLQKNKTVSMKDILKKITGVTERTLRRDLLKLQENGLAKKIGNTKSVSYSLLEK